MNSRTIDKQFLWGSGLMISPVLLPVRFYDKDLFLQLLQMKLREILLPLFPFYT